MTVVALGLLPLGVIATTTTENQGHLMARTTEYAQDKLEQLLALCVRRCRRPTRASFPATEPAAPDSRSEAAPIRRRRSTLYVDYLDVDGALVPSAGGAEPANWFYKRVWQVTLPSANLKQITVTAIVKKRGRQRRPDPSVDRQLAQDLSLLRIS